MTKQLEEAIEVLRDLPEEEQDAAADVLFAYISNEDRQYKLRPQDELDVRRIQNGLKTGATRIASDREVSGVRRKTYL